MPRKSWFALFFALLITVALVLAFLYVGGPTAVTSFVAVLGLLLAIIEFFFLHILSVRQEPRSSGHSTHKSLSAEKKFFPGEEVKRLQASKFRGRKESDD